MILEKVIGELNEFCFINLMSKENGEGAKPTIQEQLQKTYGDNRKPYIPPKAPTPKQIKGQINRIRRR